ncbi:MAG TPA: hypothetical protein VGE01_15040 [Fimbriimonas sp.]
MNTNAARRMLRELSEMAEHASLTGSMHGGEERAAARYNAVLRDLVANGAVSEGMFQPFNERDVSFAQLAVDSRLLLSSLEEDEDDEGEERAEKKGFGTLIALAPFLNSGDLGNLVKERLEGAGKINEGILVGLAPFLDRETLGDVMRHRMGKPSAPAAPAVPAAPTPPTPSRDIVAHEDRTPETTPNEELSRLATRLAQPELSPEERSQIAVRLSELALQQGQMAREE